MYSRYIFSTTVYAFARRSEILITITTFDLAIDVVKLSTLR